MIDKIWGKKIGMTQFFSTDDQNKIIPVTVVDLGKYYILQRKTTKHDGYEAIQVGCLRNKYSKVPFSLEWLKKKDKYFLFIKEIGCLESDLFEIGSLLHVNDFLNVQKIVSVSGTTIGKGFQGVVKRYSFTGGRGSHGDKLGRGPGSLSGLRTCGRVFKGKKMPGHMGVSQKTILGLKVVQYMPSDNIVLISGPVPGKNGSFVVIGKGHK
ncbi:MAG: Ribosomal protein [Bacteroidota bacterium]|jgi:large subunit ribosomal protein L3